MSHSSTDTSSPQNYMIKGAILGSRPTRCMCNLLQKKDMSLQDIFEISYKFLIFLENKNNIMSYSSTDTSFYYIIRDKEI